MKPLIFLNAVYAAAALAWIILIPYNNAPDENTHFHYSVEFILQHHRLPVWGVDDLDRFRHALSSYNQMPALNYVLYAAGAAAGNRFFGLETYLGARLVSLMWGIIFLNFLFLAAREISGNDKIAAIVTTAVALIPQVLFSFCYVNGDAHSLGIAAILGYALARFLKSQSLRRRGPGFAKGPAFSETSLRAGSAEASGDAATLPLSIINGRARASGPAIFFKFLDPNIIFLGAAIGLLFSAKYNYYIYFPCIAVTILWAALRREISWKTVGKLIIASAVLSLLISGFWFIRNAVLYGNPLPILMSEEFFKSVALAREVHPVNHGLSVASLVWMVQQGFISSTFDSFFAVFGYMNVGFGRIPYLLLEIAVPIIVALFVFDLARTSDRPVRFLLVWLLIIVFSTLAMHAWACLTFDYQPQGRYNFPILMPIALFAAWAVSRIGSLKKHVIFFMVLMVWLFVGANILLMRTYSAPVQFSINRSMPDETYDPDKRIILKARRTGKNYYATEKTALDGPAPDSLRIGFSDDYLARYRDCMIELETDKGPLAVDWNEVAPGQVSGATYDRKLNAFEVFDKNAGVILPLKDKFPGVRGVKITCRIENRRLYDLK